MNKTFKFSLKDSQVSEGEQKDPLRSSQLSTLNLNQLKGNIANCNPKSDRTPSKLNYKYERVNNSFRLVQVDPSDSDNKQNMFTGVDEQLKGDKKSQILLTLNSLTQRVQKLQKNQKYDDQKLQFNMHRLIEKVINEQSSVGFSKCQQPIEKRVEGMLFEIGELKQKVKSLSIIPNYIADSELHVIRKCKLNLDDTIAQMKQKLVAYQTEQMEKMHERMLMQMNSVIDRNLIEVVRNFETSLSKVTYKLESHFDNHFKIMEIKGNYPHPIHSECKEGRDKIWAQLQIINSRLNQKKDTQKLLKCQKQQIAELILSIGMRKIETCLQSESHMLVYGIDPNGYLVDSEGYYLLNSKGEVIQLSQCQLQKLYQSGIIQKKSTPQ